MYIDFDDRIHERKWREVLGRAACMCEWVYEVYLRFVSRDKYDGIASIVVKLVSINAA